MANKLLLVFLLVGGPVIAGETNSLTLDLSKMVDSPVAMEAEPNTNKPELYHIIPGTNQPMTNAIEDKTEYLSMVVEGTNATLHGTVKLMIKRDDGETTNVIQLLAKEGLICAVFGHSWRAGRPGEGEGSAFGGWYLDYHPNTTYRTCRICGTCQSQSLNDWK